MSSYANLIMMDAVVRFILKKVKLCPWVITEQMLRAMATWGQHELQVVSWRSFGWGFIGLGETAVGFDPNLSSTQQASTVRIPSGGHRTIQIRAPFCEVYPSG